MQAYVVRLKANAELVGLFVSTTPAKLWDVVDECVSPLACEYLPLPPGGIYLHDAGASKIPTGIDPESSNAGPDWLKGATVSELWLDIFYGCGDELKWEPVNTEDMDPWLREFE